MDRTDERLLSEMQRDASLTLQELGDKVGLSHTPCSRRMKQLSDDGYIRARVALLDPEKLHLDVNVFVNVTLSSHRENALHRFQESVQDIPEIVECYTVSGDTDMLLRIVVEDVAAYENLLINKLVHLPGVGNLSSMFALRQAKYTTELPLASRRNSKLS